MATPAQGLETPAQPVASEKMQGPAGLDLTPAPPNAKRVSKRVGLILVLGLVFVVMLIVVGVASRSNRGMSPAANPLKEDKSITAATTGGKEVANALVEQHQKLANASRDAGAEAAADSGLVAPAGSDGAPALLVKPNGKPVPSLEKVNGGAAVSTGNSYSQYREKTPEEKRRERLYDLEQQALFAPTTAQSGGSRSLASSGGAGSQPLSSPLDAVSKLMGQYKSLMGATAPTSAGSASAGSSDDQNMQDRKDAFLDKARSRAPENYLKSTRTPQMAKYEIKAGWDIPATLEQVVNSDLPGEVRALVRESVYDTATGRYLLIPQGSRVVGSYDSHIAYGQSRVQVIWSRLIYPDGTSINLDGMIGQDATGGAGFHDKVNNHYVRLASMALLTSAFSAGIQLATNQQQANPFGTPSNAQVATQAIAQQMGELGIEVTRKNMNIQPTIKIPIGYRFNIRVNRDVAFAEPYVPVVR